MMGSSPDVVARHVTHRFGDDVHAAYAGELVHQQQALACQRFVLAGQCLGVLVDQLRKTG